jgi:hypothetical protein
LVKASAGGGFCGRRPFILILGERRRGGEMRGERAVVWMEREGNRGMGLGGVGDAEERGSGPVESSIQLVAGVAENEWTNDVECGKSSKEAEKKRKRLHSPLSDFQLHLRVDEQLVETRNPSTASLKVEEKVEHCWQFFFERFPLFPFLALSQQLQLLQWDSRAQPRSNAFRTTRGTCAGLRVRSLPPLSSFPSFDLQADLSRFPLHL